MARFTSKKNEQRRQAPRRKLSFTEAKALVARFNGALKESQRARKSIGLVKTEDEIDSDAFYVGVDAASVTGDTEVVFDQDSGSAMVGPFPTPDAAEAAAPGAEILDADCNPVGGESAPVSQQEQRQGRKSVVEAFRGQFYRDLKSEAAVMGIQVDTSAGSGRTTTDGEFGNLDRSGPGAVSQQSAADQGTQEKLPDVPGDELPHLDGIEGAETFDKNGILISNGGGDGLSEKTSAGIFPGTMVIVREKTSNAKVDSGLVAKATKSEVTIRGGKEYAMDKYNFVRIG